MAPGRQPNFLVASLALGLALQGACAHPESERRSRAQTQPKPGIDCCIESPVNAEQAALARSAAGYVGGSKIKAKGRRFRFDCSGLVRGVYFSNGIDLTRGIPVSGRENGVRLIRRYVRSNGRLHQGPVTQPGDLVFFHNTWDANGDKRLNDRWTHVGIVERIEPNGTVVFVSKVSRGVERYRMNLRWPSVHRRPGDGVVNDFMRRKRSRDPEDTRYLTGELFAAFGTLTH